MADVFEELNKLYEKAEELPSLLDVVRCSTVVLVNDARSFSHEEAEKVAAKFNYDEDIDEDYSATPDDNFDPLAGRSPDKFRVNPEELRAVLGKIASNPIYLITSECSLNGRKNLRFMRDHQLSIEDVTALVKQLRESDYSFSVNSRNPAHAGSLLTIFITERDFTLPDGRVLNRIKVYVKVDATEEGIVVAVSFHDATGRRVSQQNV